MVGVVPFGGGGGGGTMVLVVCWWCHGFGVRALFLTLEWSKQVDTVLEWWG